MSPIQSLDDANVRSQAYYVACTNARCWHCDLSTRLLALALPHNHETSDADMPADGGDLGESASYVWQRANANAFLFYVEELPHNVRSQLNRLSRFYRLAHSAATLSSYWANHCEHCGVMLGDHELHCEPDGAFLPSSETAAAAIALLEMREPFYAVAAGYAMQPEYFRFMRKG